ncbi:ABC transporter substrate-binding protein [Actinomyces marmotae]|nr:ABC transporter substrate-binding protein [Actinomyces marmotae]
MSPIIRRPSPARRARAAGIVSGAPCAAGAAGPGGGPVPPSPSRRAMGAALALAGAALVGCAPKGISGAQASSAPGCNVDPTLRGTSLTLTSPLTGVEAQRLEASLEAFTTCTGISVVHTGSDMLEEDLRAGRHGDLAIVPQASIISELVSDGRLAALSNQVGANVELGWERTWGEAGTYDGTLYAAPLMASVKSFIWYSPSAFAKAGYKVPTTWAELESLTKRMASAGAAGPGATGATGGPTASASASPGGAATAQASPGASPGASAENPAPWCLPVADGPTSGWTVTDWLEDAILATQGPGAYDAWESHRVPLNDPTAVRALDSVASLVLADGHALGGRAGSSAMTLEAAGAALAEGRCYMVHASSSFETVLPDGGADLDAFLVPSASDDETPVLVGGDYLVSFSDGPGAQALAEYMTSAEWARARAALGGVATANRRVDASSINSRVGRRATEMLQSRQTLIRMDASDGMPPEVGAHTMWTALASWVAGSLDSEGALAQAERAWPTS